MRVYVAGPLFSEAERAWLDALAARLRTEGFDCFVPHENFPELADVTLEQVYRIDSEGLQSANALVAWLDGPIVDDGTACEIGMFAALARSGGDHYSSPARSNRAAASATRSRRRSPRSASFEGATSRLVARPPNKSLTGVMDFLRARPMM